jgi:hypothetical protein
VGGGEKGTMLTQSEADALFAMPKKPKSGNHFASPHAGGKLLAEVVSLDGREVLDKAFYKEL